MRRMAGPSDQKAGLSRDAEEVKRIIYEASKGSKYFAKQQAEDLKLTEKVEVLNRTLEELKRERGGDLSEEEALVDEMIRKLEEGRVVDECIVVVDADGE
jgi:DNA polymerase kappa